LKEQIACRVPPEIKEIIEGIAKREYRPLGNVVEKLLLERLRDLGYLDDELQVKKAKG
jgi:hypothetical protein